MGLLKRLIGYLKHDPKTILYIAMSRWRILPDKAQLKLMYRLKTGRNVDLKSPKTYNEKLQWLKLYDRKKVYSTMVDKYAVKKYVSDLIGKEYIIPLLGVWNEIKNIEYEKLPNQFVLKVTHGGGSGGVFICKDKKTFDWEGTKTKIKKMMRVDGYKANCEWPYKNVPHRIIAEAFVEDTRYHELRDYKFFCFNGEPKVMFVATGRGSHPEPNFDFFDMDYNRLPLKSEHPVSDVVPPCPSTFEEMKRIAAKLSKGIPHVRIDLYDVNGRVYFGEYTFFHWGGYGKFYPEEWETVLGDWIELPPKD